MSFDGQQGQCWVQYAGIELEYQMVVRSCVGLTTTTAATRRCEVSGQTRTGTVSGTVKTEYRGVVAGEDSPGIS